MALNSQLLTGQIKPKSYFKFPYLTAQCSVCLLRCNQHSNSFLKCFLESLLALSIATSRLGYSITKGVPILETSIVAHPITRFQSNFVQTKKFLSCFDFDENKMFSSVSIVLLSFTFVIVFVFAFTQLTLFLIAREGYFLLLLQYIT